MIRYVLPALAVLAASVSEHEPAEPGNTVTCERAAHPAGPDSAVVIIRDLAFAPAALNVPVGTRVVWVNCENAGAVAHTTTTDASGWDSPVLDPGEAFSVEVPAGGHPYHCRLHPGMQASVTGT